MFYFNNDADIGFFVYCNLETDIQLFIPKTAQKRPKQLAWVLKHSTLMPANVKPIVWLEQASEIFTK